MAFPLFDEVFMDDLIVFLDLHKNILPIVQEVPLKHLQPSSQLLFLFKIAFALSLLQTFPNLCPIGQGLFNLCKFSNVVSVML